MDSISKSEEFDKYLYRQTTKAITVTVEPFFIEDQSSPEEARWVFGYNVKIANDSTNPVQLVSRYWRITDGNGHLHEVRGDGVVGEQPLLNPGESFEYCSGAPLTTPTGFMTGTYQMTDSFGNWFDVEIPTFSLDAPEASATLH